MKNKELISPTFNKYFKWYWNICERAKTRELTKDIYTENHHIYPVSIYGKNDNTVKLTAKEHYIVHACLWLGFRDKYGQNENFTRKMANAFCRMNMHTEFQQRYNSKLFSCLKIALREKRKGQKASPETLRKLSESHKDQKPSEEHKANLREKFKGSGHPQSKRCFQYDMNWNFIKEHDCVKDAAEELGILLSNISAVCRCVRTNTAGFRWAYENLSNEEEVKNYTERMKNREIRAIAPVSEENRRKQSESKKGIPAWNKRK